MKLKSLIIVLVFVFMAIQLTGIASADFNSLGSACSGANGGNGQAGNSAGCQDAAAQNSNPKNPVYHIINVAADIIATIGGIAGVITIIIGGMNYVTSGGNSEAVTKGKTRIIGALIGLVIIVLAWTITNFGIKLLQ